MSVDRVLAATLVEPGRYELREYPFPEPGPGSVLVRMELSGICGTDKHTYQGYTTQYAGSGASKQIRFPVIQGHENVGTVAAIGGSGGYTDFEGISLALFPITARATTFGTEHPRLRALEEAVLGGGPYNGFLPRQRWETVTRIVSGTRLQLSCFWRVFPLSAYRCSLGIGLSGLQNGIMRLGCRRGRTSLKLMCEEHGKKKRRRGVLAAVNLLSARGHAQGTSEKASQ
jgi:Alcohol dehydrogenase GroES-like domain